MSAKIESVSVSVPGEAQELLLLETVKVLLASAIQSLSRGEGANLLEVSRHLDATACDLMAISRNLGYLNFSPEAQRERQRLLTQLRRRRSLCCALLRRWKRCILLRQQLLDLVAEPPLYSESLAPGRLP